MRIFTVAALSSALCILSAVCNCATGAPAVPLAKLDAGASIEGVWQDIQWGDLITVRRENGVNKVVAVIDSKSAEEFAVQSSAWDGMTLSYKYTIPSNSTTVISAIDGLEGEHLVGRWRLDDDTNSGEFRYKKIMDIAPADAVADAKKPNVDRVWGRVYRVRGNTVVVASGAITKVKMNGRVYVYIDGKKVYFTVQFPMITIARCAIDQSGLHLKNRITEGMPVYW